MIWIKRLRFAWMLREWPWRVPKTVALIGTERPPEHVFEAFRRLHGVDEKDGAAPQGRTGSASGREYLA